MSRIHDALVRAQTERGPSRPVAEHSPGPGLQASRRPVEREMAESPRPAFSDRDLPLVGFSPGAGSVLARAYEAIEHCVSLERGVVTEAGAAPARTVLVTGQRAAEAALALAVALTEKTRSRTLLVDADADGRGLSAMFGQHSASPGFWDGVAEGGEGVLGIRRTDLARLYFLPAGGWSESAEAALRDGGATRRFQLLAEHVPFMVVHAAGGLDEGPERELGPLVDAVLSAESLLGVAAPETPRRSSLQTARA